MLLTTNRKTLIAGNRSRWFLLPSPWLLLLLMLFSFDTTRIIRNDKSRLGCCLMADADAAISDPVLLHWLGRLSLHDHQHMPEISAPWACLTYNFERCLLFLILIDLLTYCFCVFCAFCAINSATFLPIQLRKLPCAFGCARRALCSTPLGTTGSRAPWGVSP